MIETKAEEAIEPDGTGWISGPQLVTTEISELILCRFTGDRPVQMKCPSRSNGTHPDIDCLTVYVSARNIELGMTSEMLAEEVRFDPNSSNEPLHVNPIRD